MIGNNNIFNFKGQVKASDIQAAYDELIGRINNIITTYNTTDTFLQEQDYSVGGDSIGAAGYTLTVGGIKQVLEAYNGTLIGCRIFRIDNDTCVITDGVYFTSTGIISIPSQLLEGDGSVIYLDTDMETVKRGENGDEVPEGATVLCYLTQAGSDTYMNVHRGVQVEAVPDCSISINNRQMKWGVDSDDTSAHRFQGAGVFQVNSAGASQITYQDLLVIAEGYANNSYGYRAHASADPANFLFIPKGCNSPIYVKGNNHTERTNYTMNFNKGSK